MSAVLVIAKAPVAGLAKTRLCPPATPRQAAAIAAAALLDTLEAVAATPSVQPVLAYTGRLADAAAAPEIRAALAGWRLVRQRGDSFAERLANAHADTAALFPGQPVLQIGMDTPQVLPDLLSAALGQVANTGAVLGLAADGGWWALGLRDPAHASALREVPMSTPDTGRLTRLALAGRGLRIADLPVLSDVDTWADALAVAESAPCTHFARTLAALRRDHAARTGMGWEEALAGAARSWLVDTEGQVTPLPVGRWLGPPEPAVRAVVDRCAGPTVDVGCGPGRATAEVAGRGLVSLGIDVSARAVCLARRRGATALRRDVFEPLPGEGRWSHVLLLDGNIGIGGDPAALLRRCAALLAPGGTVLVELDPDAGRWQGDATVLSARPLRRGLSFRWARLGVAAVHRVAAEAPLAVRAVFERDGRWFAELER
jgi:glycosyltransferase A (GT-A) superfamily protein (DUF2064 family)/SAM-dependent methyltransferase